MAGKITLKVRSAKGVAKIVYEVAPTVADSGAIVSTVEATLSGVSDCLTNSWSAYSEATVTASNATASASREVWAAIKCKKFGKGVVTIDIPCPKASMVMSDNVSISVTNSDLVALVDTFKPLTKWFVGNGESVKATNNIISGKIAKRSARYSH